MIRGNGIVFCMDPAGVQMLETHLRALGERALRPGGCHLELVVDVPRRPRALHAIISWDLAVPLKVERLALALVAAGGVLRRDLDAAEVRRRAASAGHHLVRVETVSDLEPFAVGPLAADGPPAGLRAVSSAA